MAYVPNPIVTEDVEVGEDILLLSECLAKNSHEVWAKQRMAEGWTWGAQRDDAKKEHPCLVPYEMLPEAEKNYDRSISMETLKVILSMGYEIKKM